MAGLNETQLQAIRQAVNEQRAVQPDPTQLTISVPGVDGPLIVNAQNGRIYEAGSDNPIANINDAPAAVNTASAPRQPVSEALNTVSAAPRIPLSETDRGTISDIQRFAQFAQNGGFEGLQGVRISKIDGEQGNNTARSMRVMSGLSNDQLNDQSNMNREKFVDLMEQKMQEDPAFRDAVIAGLQADDANPEQVQAFLDARGVDSPAALAAKYETSEVEADTTIEAPEAKTDLPPSDNPRELQALVTALGVDIGEIDGSIGPKTRGGLEALGVDPSLSTSDAIDALRSQLTAEHLDRLAENPTPDNIRTLQHVLNAMGEDLNVDGSKGDLTNAAIESVRANLRVDTAFDVTGPETVMPASLTVTADASPAEDLKLHIVTQADGTFDGFSITYADDPTVVLGEINAEKLGSPSEFVGRTGITAFLDLAASDADGSTLPVALATLQENFDVDGMKAIQAAYTGDNEEVSFMLENVIKEMEAGLDTGAPAADTSTGVPELSTAFDGANGESLMFVINNDGTITLAHADGTDADQTKTSIVDRVRTTTPGDFDATLSENPDALRDGMIKAITAHLGIGEGGNAAFVQSEFDALWKNTEYWGSGNPDNIPELAYNVLSDIRENFFAAEDATIASQIKTPLDIVTFDVSITSGFPDIDVEHAFNGEDWEARLAYRDAIETNFDSVQEKLQEAIFAQLEGLEPEDLQFTREMQQSQLEYTSEGASVARLEIESTIAAIDAKLEELTPAEPAATVSPHGPSV